MTASHETPFLGDIAEDKHHTEPNVVEQHNQTGDFNGFGVIDSDEEDMGATGNGDSSSSSSGRATAAAKPATPDATAADSAKLKLSGRILSVLTTLPQCAFQKDGYFELRKRRGGSALYDAIDYVAKGYKSVLVGWTGEIEELQGHTISPTEKESIGAMFLKANPKHHGVVPVWMDREDELSDQGRWRRYAEDILWPVMHYIQGEPTDGRVERQWYEDYVKLNAAYADAVVGAYKPGDIIWIHDYYLLLLPQMLRSRLPQAYIGLFLHIPFPSSEYFRCLSKRKDLLDGMLGANIVGTQSYAYSRHLISACKRLLGVEGSPTHVSAYGLHVSVETLPIGINTVAVEHDAFQPDVDAKVKAIRELYGDKKIIVGRDRLDSVRGVIQKLRAFEMFLELYPEWREKVVLIQVTSPATYLSQKSESKVAELVQHINSTYGGLHFSPVQHFPRFIAKEEYLALLRVADLGLITTLRDGMNTTCLEYVVCQRDSASPIILSEFSGTAGSLIDAIQVNPWDAVDVADKLNYCLTDSAENRADFVTRQEKLYAYVTTHPVQNWVDTFVSLLRKNLLRHDSNKATPALNRALLSSVYNKAKRRVFLFDYDGTLTPIVRDPSAAIPNARLYRILDGLTADPRNVVWIISGRDAKFLDKWLGKNLGIAFSAEHGCFIKEFHSTEWVDLTKRLDMSWKKEVIDIMRYFTERTQGSMIETKQAAITWHYRNADPEFGVFQSRVLRNHLEQTVERKYNVEIMAGKANIEVRPKELNKGEIVRRILDEFKESPEFAICLGDDKTDEDMFEVLKEKNNSGYFPVSVGGAFKRTSAQYHLVDPAAVLDTLEYLLANDEQH